MTHHSPTQNRKERGKTFWAMLKAQTWSGRNMHTQKPVKCKHFSPEFSQPKLYSEALAFPNVCCTTHHMQLR